MSEYLSDFETILLLDRSPNLKQIKILMEPNTVHHKYYHQYIILVIGFIWPDFQRRRGPIRTFRRTTTDEYGRIWTVNHAEHTGMEPFEK